MHALEPYIAPLTLDIPPPAAPRNMLDNISAKQVARRVEKQGKNLQKKLNKKSRKKHDRNAKAEAKAMEEIAKLQYLVIEDLYA
jgi:uncharacterized protein (DUF3084 family)